MLDYLVLYQSESGNTKKIAASIFSRLPGNSTAGRTTNDNPHPDTDNSTTGDQEQ